MMEPQKGTRLVAATTDAIGEGLVSFELVLYAFVGLLLGVAGILIIGGTISGLVRDIGNHHSAIDVAIVVLDRVLLALIVGELLYTLRFVVRTHEIAVEPFLYIGIIAVVRRILDRKSTRLNSSHPSISYAVFCLKKKNKHIGAAP